MMICNRFFFKTFDVDIIAILVMIGIALTSHAAGAILIQGIEVAGNNFLGCLFPAFLDRKGHNVPYHIAYSFDYSRYNYGITYIINAASFIITQYFLG